MSIYNLQYLQEMKTKEEYSRSSFKKKYNYKPSKDNKDIGEITVDGKKIIVDMGKGKYSYLSNDKRQTSAMDNTDDPTIILDDKFFKLKGSNKNERRDATLQHEIGHTRLHGISADSDKKSVKIFKDNVNKQYKKKGIDISKFDDEDSKEMAYELSGIGRYTRNATTDKNKIEKRENAFNRAKKFETNGTNHADAFEFEADRYAANRTSTSAIKRSIRNGTKLTIANKQLKKDAKEAKIIPTKENIKNEKKKYNKEILIDHKQRFKALKDKDMQNEKIYKK